MKKPIIMKKFIPYLLFCTTTLHAIIGVSPIMAMGCNSSSDKLENVCEEGDANCQRKVSASKIN